MKKISAFFGLAILLSIASSCGGGGSKPAPKRDADGHELYQGDLLEGFALVQKGDMASSCDRTDAGIQKEMTDALAKHEAELVTQSENRPMATQSEDHPNVKKFKTMVFLDIPPTEKARPGYQTSSYSWRSAYEEFQKFKSDPKSGGWSWLNERMRAILFDDMNRAVYYKNVYLQPDSAAGVRRYLSEVSACAENSACKQIEHSPETTRFLQGQPLYLKMEISLTESKDEAEFRKNLKEYVKLLDRDRKRYDITPYTGMTRRDQKTFVLSVDPNGSTDTAVLDFVKAEVENKWRDADHQVQVEWTDSKSVGFKIMKMVLSQVIGGRSNTNYFENTVNFYFGDDRRTIPHEFGHVMGFPDDYFTLWNDQTCTYTQLVNEESVMGHHMTGSVTPSHWKQLEEAYPIYRAP